MVAAADTGQAADEGGREQQRHPSLENEVQSAGQDSEPEMDRSVIDDEDVVSDKRAIEQAQRMAPVIRGHAIDVASTHEKVLGL